MKNEIYWIGIKATGSIHTSGSMIFF